MKIIILLLLSSNFSWAGIGSSHGGSVINKQDLQSYANNYKVNIRSEQISFSANISTTFVPAIKVCIEGDEYRTQEKYDLYAPEKRDRSVIIGQDYLRRKIELDSNNNPIKKTFEVVIYKISKREISETVIKSGDYYLPDCE